LYTEPMSAQPGQAAEPQGVGRKQVLQSKMINSGQRYRKIL
jgi:hypothetical protein